MNIYPAKASDSMTPTPLNVLTTRTGAWTIKIKVLRLWDTINLLTNDHISTDTILSSKLRRGLQTEQP